MGEKLYRTVYVQRDIGTLKDIPRIDNPGEKASET
jgi:hypothetical protein